MSIKINRTALAAAGVLAWAGLINSSASADGSIKYAPEEATESTVVWTGIDKASGAFAVYDGFVTALNGDDSTDGVLVRGEGLYVDTKEGTIWEGSPMLGYQIVRDGLTMAAFVGPDFQQLPNSTLTTVRGYRDGFKVAINIENDEDSRIVVKTDGEYSTAFETYWARVRAGYNFKSFVVGPEGTFLGNEGFSAERAGAFITIPVGEVFGHKTDFTFSGGYQWVAGFNSVNLGSPLTTPASTVGDTGGYFNIGIVVVF